MCSLFCWHTCAVAAALSCFEFQSHERIRRSLSFGVLLGAKERHSHLVANSTARMREMGTQAQITLEKKRQTNKTKIYH